MALTLAIKSGTRGIYFSADSDSATQYARAVSMLSGELVGEVQKKMEAGDTDQYDEVLAPLRRIRFDFNPAPTLDDLDQTVLAYGYLHGRYPELIILDNLSSIDDEGAGDGFQALEATLAYLKELASKTKACVVVLHHLTGQWEDGVEPAPLSGLRGKVSKLPELILNLFRSDDDIDAGLGVQSLGVAIVKNRSGQASAAGRYVVLLAMDLERMLIADSFEDEPLDWTI